MGGSYVLRLEIAFGKKDYAPIDQTDFFKQMELLNSLIEGRDVGQEKLPRIIELDTGMHGNTGTFMPIKSLLRRGYEIDQFNLQGGPFCYSDWLEGSTSKGYCSYRVIGENRDVDPKVLEYLQKAGLKRIKGKLENLLKEERV